MKIAYLNMESGASGDMIVASLINAGLPFENLKKIFTNEKTPSVKISTEKIVRNSIEVQKFNVELSEMEHHTHRHLPDVFKLVDTLDISDKVKKDVENVFTVLAESEAKMHGISIDRVHFHEVGACDSIVDIVSIMYGLDYFGVEKIFVNNIPMPHGTIECQHGTIPNPSPATMHLLKGFKFKPFDSSKEMVTPTAAAVIKTLTESEKELNEFKPELIGMGAGNYIIPETPGYLRISIGEGTL